MYLSRELAYNKKGNIQFFRVECLPVILQQTFNSFELSVYFFITTIKMIRRNKMIVMYLRTFMIKVLFFIISNIISMNIRGRHSTNDVLNKL